LGGYIKCQKAKPGPPNVKIPSVFLPIKKEPNFLLTLALERIPISFLCYYLFPSYLIAEIVSEAYEINLTFAMNDLQIGTF
jgi:hypothetical protein